MPQPKPEHCTPEDYWSLPEGERAELIDGTLYSMAPPSREHQELAGGVYFALRSHIAQQGGDCRVYIAPFAVNLAADDTTWVEPDVTVVCDPSKLSERGCEGAPDLVVEVVSPHSQRMDYIRKTSRYEQAGVREYWIVDPAVKSTVVYRFQTRDPLLQTYPFDTPIPVGIWERDGEGTAPCTVVIDALR